MFAQEVVLSNSPLGKSQNGPISEVAFSPRQHTPQQSGRLLMSEPLPPQEGSQMDAAHKQNRPICWALSDGAAGHRSQVRGLAEALNFETRLIECRLGFPWNRLPSRLVPLRPAAFRPRLSGFSPPPDIVISCGRQAALAALALKRVGRKPPFLVHVQDPQRSHHAFDLIVPPEHDALTGENVVATLGAMHPLTLETLREAAGQGPTAEMEGLTAQFTAVLLGGPNKYYAFDDVDVRLLIELLQRVVASEEVQLAIVPSRRTPPEAVHQLQQTFGENHFVWDGKGENPYLPTLALCQWCIVTADSVSMLSEATATGQPVYIAPLAAKRPARKFECFHEALIAAGYARKFTGTLEEWRYEPAFEAQRIAEIVQQRFRPDA